MKTKRIDYAHPTSDYARRFKALPGQGCYVVEILDGTNEPEAVAAFHELEPARRYANDNLREPWNSLTK